MPQLTADTNWRSKVGIPIRNLWLLLVYASDLAAFKDRFSAEIDDDAEIADILARLLTSIVERRLRRNLSRGYRSEHATLSRLRGRVDWLQTISGMHLKRGRVVCHFQELTFDTPRNRLVGAALRQMSASVADHKLSVDCRRLAEDLARLGVLAVRPSDRDLSRDQIASHQSDDSLMISVAKLALDMLLPSETLGNTKATRLDRDEALLHRIFEKAIAGFYSYELRGCNGWHVRFQSPIDWAAKPYSSGALALLPGMRPDIILEQGLERRIVIDTKFTAILTKGQYGGHTFKSSNLYQIYAYLRSQAGRGNSLCDKAEGILLYPSLNEDVDEAVDVQGHRIRFVTVNLALKSSEVLNRLRRIIG